MLVAAEGGESLRDSSDAELHASPVPLEHKWKAEMASQANKTMLCY